MTTGLVEPVSDAIPITIVDKKSLPRWLEASPQHARWVAAMGFKAEPGSVVVLPKSDGGVERVLAAANDGPPVWSLAGLPSSLPEGQYAFERTAVAQYRGLFLIVHGENDETVPLAQGRRLAALAGPRARLVVATPDDHDVPWDWNTFGATLIQFYRENGLTREMSAAANAQTP